jgi:hypothetical protein
VARYFTISWSLSAAVLISVLAYVVSMRMHTELAAPAATEIELDVAGLVPGEIRTFRTWDGEFWVLRRTAEQIADLERGPTPALPPGSGSQPRALGRLRSADREFFVFRVQRLGDGIMLTQPADRYLVCSDLRLFRGARSYAGGIQITDGLSCADDPQVAYDLAGMPASPFLAPLEVPRHELRRNVVVVRPEN